MRLTLLTFLVLLSTHLRANDTFVTLGAGGLVSSKTTAISMESEDLTISSHLITVKYVFRNDTDRDIDATVAFPLPELDGAEVANEPMEIPAKDPLNFVHFKVEVDGRPVSPHTEVRAFKNGHDITSRLRSIGLPLSVYDSSCSTAIRKLAPNVREQLAKEEIIVDEEDSRNNISEHWPWWQTRVQYFWSQRFPAHSSITIRHTYRPVVGGGYFYEGVGRARDKEYCGDPSRVQQQLDRVRKNHPKKKDEIEFYERQIQYILTTANTWQGPIKNFHLTVTTDHSYDVLVSCEKDLKQTAATRYEALRMNFHPNHELDLLILQTDEPLADWHQK